MRFWIRLKFIISMDKKVVSEIAKNKQHLVQFYKKKDFQSCWTHYYFMVPFFSSWIVFNTNTFINYSCRFHFVNCVYLFICIPLRIILPVWNFIQSRRRSPGVSWCANPTDFTVRMKMQMKKINYTFFNFFVCIRRKNIIYYNNMFFLLL